MRVLTLRGARVVGICTKRSTKSERHAGPLRGRRLRWRASCRNPRAFAPVSLQCNVRESSWIALICNAGIMALPKLEMEHGFEKQFFVNHIGHFMLVTGLLDQLADDGRVVILSSAAHSMAPKGGIEFDKPRWPQRLLSLASLWAIQVRETCLLPRALLAVSSVQRRP